MYQVIRVEHKSLLTSSESPSLIYDQVNLDHTHCGGALR